MAGAQIQCRALVLSVDHHGDRFEKLRLVGDGLGLTMALQRLPSKSTAARSRAQLFELGVGQFREGKMPGALFLEDWSLEHRPGNLGSHYARFKTACRMARFLLDNLPMMAGCDPQFDLIVRALQAFSNSDAADLVYFKFLFQWTRSEGYPVKEQWLEELPAGLRQEAHLLLFRPTAESADGGPSLARLLRSLEQHLRQSTDLRLPLEQGPGSTAI